MKKPIERIVVHNESHAAQWQNLRDEFKAAVYIGKKMKNRRNGEKGVVVGVYPHIFTMRLDCGLMSSYSYNCFMEFGEAAAT